MSAVDFRSVRLEIKEAARRAFALLRSKHPDEHFYTFALSADNDEENQGVCPSANTEEGYRRRLKRDAPSRAEYEAKGLETTYADHLNYYRWNLPEWAYDGDGNSEFRALDPLIFHDDDFEENDPVGFLAFQAQLHGCMILAMKDLDGEGFFGEDERRADVTLFCDLVEPPEKYWFAFESARLLNPPSVFDAFSTQWLPWLGREGREIIRDPELHSPTYRPLHAFLTAELAD